MKHWLIALLVSCVCASAQMGVRSPALVSAATKRINASASKTPDQVTGLFVWNKIDSLTKNVGDAVDSWTDSSGTGFTMTSSGLQMPIYTNNAGVLNSKSWLQFIAASNCYLTTFGDDAIRSQPNTYFIVARVDTATAWSVLVDGDSRNASYRNLLGLYSAGELQLFAGTDLVGPAAPTLWRLYEFTLSSTVSNCRTNGVTIISDGDAGANSAQGFTLGNSRPQNAPLNGGIAEFCGYNANVSASDRSALREYFRNKYFPTESW